MTAEIWSHAGCRCADCRPSVIFFLCCFLSKPEEPTRRA